MSQVQHIVVVDDEQPAREMVGDYLRMHGFSVSLCDGGASPAQGHRPAGARPHRPRSQYAGGGRAFDHSRSQAAHQRADHHAHRNRERDRPGRRSRARRGRLSGQTVRAARNSWPGSVRSCAAAAPVSNRRSSPRRSPPPAPERARVRFGTKWLDHETQALRDDQGNEHPLTASEYGLLKVFAANPKRVLSRDRLLELANARDAEAFDRAIDLRIMRIRRKIEPDPAHPSVIRTVRGGGYLFSPAAKHLRWIEQKCRSSRNKYGNFITVCFVAAVGHETIPATDETIFPRRRNIEATGAC